jgi:hypothetical protein
MPLQPAARPPQLQSMTRELGPTRMRHISLSDAQRLPAVLRNAAAPAAAASCPGASRHVDDSHSNTCMHDDRQTNKKQEQAGKLAVRRHAPVSMADSSVAASSAALCSGTRTRSWLTGARMPRHSKLLVAAACAVCASAARLASLLCSADHQHTPGMLPQLIPYPI